VESSNRTYRIVYTIVERRGRKFWLRIGASFRNSDGSENVLLDAMPTNGQLQIREVRMQGGQILDEPSDGAEPGLGTGLSTRVA